MLQRRSLLGNTGAGLLLGPFAPRLALAGAPTSKRCVLLLARGGLDGLHALAPYADRDYRALRPTLALYADAAPVPALNLDGYFAFHPDLAPLADLYGNGELLVLPASTSRYRDRSHFDAQNVLETGADAPYGARDGWLNRALAGLNDGDPRLGLALGPTVPLLLQGDTPVQTWSDSQLPPVTEEFLYRLAQMYADDAAFARTLEQAQGTRPPDIDADGMRSNPPKGQSLSLSAQAAADFLARREGPRIAVLESTGWDTHFDQSRRLSLLFAEVADALITLRQGLGSAWGETVVIVVSEFGRTAAENGSRGTDHGTGGIALAAGGAVAGGQILGDWPGLSRSALYEERDVLATSSYESLFKAILVGHLGLTEGFVEDRVFPASRDLAPLAGVLRSGRH